MSQQIIVVASAFELNLTINGTGPQQTDAVLIAGAPGPITGEFRVVEIVGASDTTVFTGLFNVAPASFDAGEPPVVTNRSVSDVSAFSSARTSTGSVSYRLDVRRTSGGALVSDLSLYLFARRA